MNLLTKEQILAQFAEITDNCIQMHLTIMEQAKRIKQLEQQPVWLEICQLQEKKIKELEQQLADATSCNDNCTAKVKELKAHHKTLIAEKESYSQKQLDKLIVENVKLKQIFNVGDLVKVIYQESGSQFVKVAVISHVSYYEEAGYNWYNNRGYNFHYEDTMTVFLINGEITAIEKLA
jgi:hypothetical protein